jgi:diketogulonate reductase-like aldo/keto reductase
VVDSILHALEIGYRHINTAALYDNEREVGEAVRRAGAELGIGRDEIFVTTKLWNSDHGYENALRAFEDSRRKLGLDYVDLYLIHWPVEGQRLDSWRALERIHGDGKARTIGVSNYMPRHLDELLGDIDGRGGEVRPVVDQVEFSPLMYQPELHHSCIDGRIQLEAYSPLTKSRLLDDAGLNRIAAKYARSSAQILIRWALQKQVVVIPKSSDPGRIRENAEVFDFTISDYDMGELDALNDGTRTSWDPTDIP